MDKAIEMRLQALGSLSRAGGTAAAVPCKVCGAAAPVFRRGGFQQGGWRDELLPIRAVRRSCELSPLWRMRLLLHEFL